MTMLEAATTFGWLTPAAPAAIAVVRCPVHAGVHNRTLLAVGRACFAQLRDVDRDLQALYEARYSEEWFVDVMPAGAHPETRSVRGANQCRLAVHRPQQGHTVVILAVIDNLVKGAAGQAVQNMNVMFALAEQAGLGGVAQLP